MEKDKRTQLVKLLSDQLEVIERQIRELTDDADAIRRAVGILKGSAKQIRLMSEPTVSAEFEGMKPTPAILKLLKKEDEKAFRASELTRELLRRGMKPKSVKMFPNTVSALANRLAVLGRIEREKKDFDGKEVWVYRKKRTGV